MRDLVVGDDLEVRARHLLQVPLEVARAELRRLRRLVGEILELGIELLGMRTMVGNPPKGQRALEQRIFEEYLKVREKRMG